MHCLLSCKREQLDARAKKAIFLGYARGVKGYRLWSLDEKKFVISRDVTFDEGSVLASGKKQVQVDGGDTSGSQVVEIEPSVGDTDDYDDVGQENIQPEDLDVNAPAHEEQ